MTSLVLAKYDAGGQLKIVTHITLGVNRQKIREASVEEGRCPVSQVPTGHEDAVWLKPVVCTIEYMPSERDGYRQAVFKGFRDDKLPEECR